MREIPGWRFSLVVLSSIFVFIDLDDIRTPVLYLLPLYNHTLMSPGYLTPYIRK
jgi:hypothetical protein